MSQPFIQGFLWPCGKEDVHALCAITTVHVLRTKLRKAATQNVGMKPGKQLSHDPKVARNTRSRKLAAFTVALPTGQCPLTRG